MFDESGSNIPVTSKVISKQFSLASGEKTQIKFGNSPLSSPNNNASSVYGNLINVSFKKINIIWSFQCEDPFGTIHYYKAKLYVEDSNEFIGDLWSIEKVG